MELYIHIPFCRQKCRYCDFTSFAGREEYIGPYTQALLKEAAHRAPLVTEPVRTVYIGGGTPSLLPADTLRRLTDGLRRLLPMENVREFTIEANPGTVTPAWLTAARACGANRLSFGMQAFQPRLLRTLGRIHDFDAVTRSFRLAREAGFDNLSLDLMFGIPGQTPADWRKTLKMALSLSPEHISAYGLIPEEGTPLQKDLETGVLSLPEEEEERAMYDETLKELSRQGFVQYEISNFARPGRECLHNLGYWRQEPYLGLGLSAASMFVLSPADGSEPWRCLRQTNPDSVQAYEVRLASSTPDGFRTSETVAGADARFETMRLGLRLNEGVSGRRFAALHGTSPEACWGPTLNRLEAEGFLTHDGDVWRLTRRGQDVQNSVLVELLD